MAERLVTLPAKVTQGNTIASVHKFPAVKTGHQGEFGAGS
jgi:hypothetical protein